MSTASPPFPTISHLPFNHNATKLSSSNHTPNLSPFADLRVQSKIEQQTRQQRLSAVINAPTIAGFLDPTHIDILDTLLDLQPTSVNIEIRTEHENGTVVRFPVLTLCLDGLGRVLDKHEIAKQILQETINSEGGQPGVFGNLVQNLPIARTGFLSAGPASGELDSLKRDLEASYNAKVEKLKEEHARAKEEIIRIRAKTLAKCQKALEVQQKQNSRNYKQRLSANTAVFQTFQDKWYIGANLEDGSFARMTYRTAAKLISKDPKMFNEYRGLCIRTIKTYKQELKDQYRTHLHDVELECRKWLKDNASGQLGADETSEGLQQTLFEARAWDPVSILTPGRKNKMENPSIYMTQDELEEEAKEIMGDFQVLQQKDVSEGGLGLQPVEYQNTLFEAAIQVRNSQQAGSFKILVRSFSY